MCHFIKYLFACDHEKLEPSTCGKFVFVNGHCDPDDPLLYRILREQTFDRPCGRCEDRVRKLREQGDELEEKVWDVAIQVPTGFYPRNIPQFVFLASAKLKKLRLQLAYDTHRVTKIEREQIKALAEGTLPGMNQQDLERRRSLFREFLADSDWRRCPKFKGLTVDEVVYQVLP
ncbi:hypothetical protein BU16DRAFT_566867 [Lophium mytilinum]|uniref:Uncharacterized protein n=1 Tax=Lophium mytilinum TaxID=390894 RepID=A0A6A6QCM8_9PEZI|nr:hypothetical protein BU16DRAFT_566867 [Lophium mytilinum]